MKSYIILTAFSLLYLTPKLHAQCLPELLTCNALPASVCDMSPNDPAYWNDILWWDALNLSHDLSETEVNLALAVRDTCPGSVQARCLLYFDLDMNGAYETVVDSDNPPGPGSVQYNNANNPNFEGGTTRFYDHRMLDSLDKWRFALKASTAGTVTLFQLRWTNSSGSIAPELPLGLQKVRWIISNDSGAQVECEKAYVVKDCKAPTVVCLNGLSVNMMPTQMITLWASDFLQYAEDNSTSAAALKYGIRKAGTGTGFPVDAMGNPQGSVTYTCAELGEQFIELWSIDASGNAGYCETFVLVQDALNNCNEGEQFYQSCAISYCDNQLLDEVEFNYVAPPIPLNVFENGNCASVDLFLPQNTLLTVSAEKFDNPLAGVTTWDLVTLDKIVDGTASLNTPYQWIAADANRDNIIDPQDVVECRKLILGIYTELPNNTSWRFVPKDYVFPTPNPLSQPYPESITINTSDVPLPSLDFVGVKICDVSCGGVTGFFETEAENQHLIGEAEPNPSSGDAVIPVQLLEQAPVMLEVYDLSGRLCYRQENMYPAGGIIVPVPASAMPQAGMYLWTMRAGEVTKTGKLLRY